MNWSTPFGNGLPKPKGPMSHYRPFKRQPKELSLVTRCNKKIMSHERVRNLPSAVQGGNEQCAFGGRCKTVCGCGSGTRTNTPPLANGTKDQNLRDPSSFILSHTHVFQISDPDPCPACRFVALRLGVPSPERSGILGWAGLEELARTRATCNKYWSYENQGASHRKGTFY